MFASVPDSATTQALKEILKVMIRKISEQKSDINDLQLYPWYLVS